jgi:hypothetical protein
LKILKKDFYKKLIENEDDIYKDDDDIYLDNIEYDFEK